MASVHLCLYFSLDIWKKGYIPIIMFFNEDCNCALLRTSASHFTSIYNKSLKSTGLNITQFVLLKYIFLLKQTNLNTLNKFLHQNRSTIGRNLNVIRKLNFISIFNN